MSSRVFTGIVGVAAVVATIGIPAHAAVADVAAPAIPIVRPASPFIGEPISYPSQTDLVVVPDNPSDASISRGVRPYDEIAPFVNDLMDATDRLSAQVVGKSALDRDIYLLTLTSPETEAETARQAAWRDEVKYDPASAAADGALLDGYKVPIWFNANIHGNEWEGTDATLDYIEDLATSTDPAIQDLLDTHRLYFTVTNNPDGRALGQRATATGYDANRDMITGATVESTIVRDLAAVIQPTYFVDLHGYTNILQVEPCGPPHGENYEYDLFLPHAYAAALAIEQAVVAADIPGNTYADGSGRPTTTNTGKVLIPYRDIREGWDDWPPIFAPQYVAYQGAITNTVELPLGRVAQPDATGEGPRRAAINIQVAEVVIDSTVDYVVEESDELLANQIEIFRRGLAGTESPVIPADITPADLPEGMPTEWTEIWDETDIYRAEYPRAYVIPTGEDQRSDSDADTLVRQLLVHGVQVEQLTADSTLDGVVYPAGSYYVDMHQPLRGLANVMLDEGTDISDRIAEMYDVSAWSLALLWGADVVSIGSTTDAAPSVSTEPVAAVESAGSVPAQGSYLAFQPRGLAEYQAITALLGEGVALSQLPDGTVVLGPDADSHAAATAVAEVFGIDFSANDGAALRDGPSTALKAVRIGYTGNAQERDALVKLGFTDAVRLTAADITSGATDLTAIDLIFVGSSLTFAANGSQAAGQAAVAAYVAAGKPVVGLGVAGANFARAAGVADVSAFSGTGGTNGIVSVETPAAGVLGDYPQDTAFVYPAVWFQSQSTSVTSEQRYAADPLISGHWPGSSDPAATSDQSDAAGQSSAVSATGATGSRLFLFGTSPTFRNHPVGAFSDLARAIYWAAGEGTPVVAPEQPVEPEPETPGGGEPGAGEPGDGGTGGQPVVEIPESAGESTGSIATTGLDATPFAGTALGLLLLGLGAAVIGRTRSRSSAAR